MCRELTRREMLRFAGLVAATPLVVRYSRPVKAFAQVASRAIPMNLELVTLTDTSAVLTWFTGDPTSLDQYNRPAPLPANTMVRFGTSPANLQTVVERDDQTPYHYVELVGLQPGQTYFYECLSNGMVATPTLTPGQVTSTGVFTTAVPPPGRLLFTMAWANDAHIGESVSGLAVSAPPGFPVNGFPPGFPVDPANPYWQVMAEAAVAESRGRGAELLLIGGDLTSEAEPINMARAKSYLDGFGTYRKDYYVVRGNHDRPHSGAAYVGCRPTATSGVEDCLLDTFFPDGRTYFSFDHKGVHFAGLDTNDAAGSGAITAAQFEWLEQDLKAHSGVPTFIFGHHPVTEESTLTATPPIIFTLNQQDAARLEGDVASHSVVGVYSGHTHRNKRTSSPRAPNVPFIELGAVKEYPGGYGLVRVHEGGYAVNFYKTRSDPSKAWSERSRGEYLGLYPYYTLGNLSDRNFTVAADFSDAARSGRNATGGAGGSGGSAGGRPKRGSTPSTGGLPVAPAVGAVALGAGVAAATIVRKHTAPVEQDAEIAGNR